MKNKSDIHILENEIVLYFHNKGNFLQKESRNSLFPIKHINYTERTAVDITITKDISTEVKLTDEDEVNILAGYWFKLQYNKKNGIKLLT